MGGRMYGVCLYMGCVVCENVWGSVWVYLAWEWVCGHDRKHSCMHACMWGLCNVWVLEHAEDKHVTCAASSHVGSTSAASTLSLARM